MEYRIYRQNLKIKSVGQVEKLVGEEVPLGYVLEVTHMSVTDITSGAKVLELGYIDAGGEDRPVCLGEGTNQHHHHVTGEVYLVGEEKPYGRITTAGANDMCYFNCHGKLWPLKPGGARAAEVRG